jgi:23S rRNA A2030 N6-methylase RlmJ
MLVNPPFVLAEQMSVLLPELLAILKQAPGSGCSVTWLTPS